MRTKAKEVLISQTCNNAYKGKKGSTDLSDLSLSRWLGDMAIQQGVNRVSCQVTVIVVVIDIDVSSTTRKKIRDTCVRVSLRVRSPFFQLFFKHPLSRRWYTAACAIFCLYLTFLRSRCAMDIELLAVLLNVGFSAVTTEFPWRTRWLMLVIRWRRADRLSGHFTSSHSGSVVFPQSRGRCCGAWEAAARGVRWPRSPFGASGCSRLHGYARASRSAERGRSGLPPEVISRGALTSWWVPVSRAR